MKILVLNCGSSSIKYQLLDMANDGDLMAKGLLERVGLKDSELKHQPKDKEAYKLVADVPDHQIGINIILEALVDPNHGVLKTTEEITAVGHRVVLGGEEFSDSTVITPDVRAALEKYCDLAPLHNPANLKGIYSIDKILPNVPQVGVFDTSFHQTMPPYAYIYGLPYSYYEKHKIRRYGYHGTSHKFVAEKAAKLIGKDWKDINIITCHLGNGSSIAAIKKSKSIDTTMGLTPNEGLVMGTRTGDLDLGALLFLMEKENLDLKQANDLINKKSGMLGLSGVSYDMREIHTSWENGNENAKLALDVFCYKVKKYIGSYAAAMGGIDLIVFTGGIGENDYMVRQWVCEGLEFLGVDFDKEKNYGVKGKDILISNPNSKVKVMAVTTNEEYVIAMDTLRILSKN